MSEDGQVKIVGRRPFACIPEALLYDPKVSSDAVRVYGVLLRHGDDPNSCYPSHQRIATLIGKSQRSVQKWVVELEEAGWIKRFQREGRSCGYLVYAALDSAPPADKPRAAQRGDPALHNAPKESQGTRASKKPSAAVAAVVPKATDDPIVRHARQLTQLAFEQPVKPTMAVRGKGNEFCAAMKIIEKLLRAGRSVGSIEQAILDGVDTWTVAGFQTAIAKSRRRPRSDPRNNGGPSLTDQRRALAAKEHPQLETGAARGRPAAALGTGS